MRLGLAAGQLLARRDVSSRPTPRFELDPSSLPEAPPPGSGAWRLRMMHLLPYRVAFDAAQGGVALAWLEPAVRLSPRLSLLSKVELLDFESRSEPAFQHAGAAAHGAPAGCVPGRGAPGFAALDRGADGSTGGWRCTAPCYRTGWA